MSKDASWADRCRAYFESRWQATCTRFVDGPAQDALGREHAWLIQLVQECLTSRIKSYHYVLPTQVLCKVVDPSLNAHSLQVAWGVPGAFDARTIAHSVIVPFDQANQRVLGGSTEPYVNNPLRCPAVSREYREQQKEKQDWDKLVRVLDFVEQIPVESVSLVFDQILIEIYRLLSLASVSTRSPTALVWKRRTNL